MDLGCTTTHEYTADSQEKLAKLPFVRQLREIQVPTSQSELLALHEIYYQDPGLQDVFQDTVPWFPHMEQEVPVRFLHACGVGTAATEDVLMKRLSQMVDQVGGHAGEDMHGRMGAGMLEQQSNSKISDRQQPTCVPRKCS